MAHSNDRRLAHLVGPGGAGKTSVGHILAHRLGWQFIDLDLYFMAREGDIAGFIAAHGYAAYARRNVELYAQATQSLASSAVFVLSSGFMTYAEDVHPGYRRIRDAIETDAFTALLMPSFDLEGCARMIVQRQLARPYLQADEAKEMSRIRERFPLFLALRCARFESDSAPEEIAVAVERFVRRQSASQPI